MNEEIGKDFKDSYARASAESCVKRMLSKLEEQEKVK